MLVYFCISIIHTITKLLHHHLHYCQCLSSKWYCDIVCSLLICRDRHSLLASLDILERLHWWRESACRWDDRECTRQSTLIESGSSFLGDIDCEISRLSESHRWSQWWDDLNISIFDESDRIRCHLARIQCTECHKWWGIHWCDIMRVYRRSIGCSGGSCRCDRSSTILLEESDWVKLILRQLLSTCTCIDDSHLSHRLLRFATSEVICRTTITISIYLEMNMIPS